MAPDTLDLDPTSTLTLEAFADTIIPGEKRHPGDRSVAGAAPGGGAVAAGALDLMTDPATGIADGLESLADTLNAHAEGYAAEHDLALDDAVPPFVGLAFGDRTALVGQLTAPEHPEKEMWVSLAVFSTMAFDSAAHLSTPAALAAGHPGLLTIGFMPPTDDGSWRFPDFSYRRPLADLHPGTTPSGSPS